MVKSGGVLCTSLNSFNLYHFLGKFSRQQIDNIFLIFFFQKIGLDISYKLSPDILEPIFWEK